MHREYYVCTRSAMHVLYNMPYGAHVHPPLVHTLFSLERQYIQLYEAIRHSDLTSLQTALNAGMSVDMRDKYNKTPLMIACAHGRPDVANFFLERGYVVLSCCVYTNLCR